MTLPASLLQAQALNGAGRWAKPPARRHRNHCSSAICGVRPHLPSVYPHQWRKHSATISGLHHDATPPPELINCADRPRDPHLPCKDLFLTSSAADVMVPCYGAESCGVSGERSANACSCGLMVTAALCIAAARPKLARQIASEAAPELGRLMFGGAAGGGSPVADTCSL